MTEYKFSLPIYYTQNFKTKKSKTFLVGANWYRNAHFHISNEVKKHYHDLVKTSLNYIEGEALGNYSVKYKLFYRNSQSDLMNVVSVIDKFVNDAIQNIGLVKNDNVNFYDKCFIEVGGHDKTNPRLEVIIRGLNENI